MDAIFKALGDPARRDLLDSLRARDGQSLSDLEEVLEMSRFGVMKHLKVLEAANLIVTRKVGRFKYHYLNALPLQDVMDRWAAPFLQQQARALTELKAKLEQDADLGQPDFMMQITIRCTQDALWSALTKADEMTVYHDADRTVQGDAAVGQTTDFILPNGDTALRQTTTALDPKSRIAVTVAPMTKDAPTHHMAFLIAPRGDHCKLTIEHYDIAHGPVGLAEDWVRIAAALKSYLETGNGMKAAM
jgi:DNA-binding transcriptional ArsR family regulator